MNTKRKYYYYFFARPGSLYVSGAPGTGKTATLTHLLAARSGRYQAVFINCMVLKSSMAIYKEVAAQLCPTQAVKTEKEALRVIEKTITSKGPMILLGTGTGKPIVTILYK
jgi:cell division control protein 6